MDQQETLTHVVSGKDLVHFSVGSGRIDPSALASKAMQTVLSFSLEDDTENLKIQNDITIKMTSN